MGMKKDTKTRTVKESIKNQFEPYRRGFTDSCPQLYSNLISDLDDYIDSVSRATPEICMDHIALANQALSAITWTGNPYDNNIELTDIDRTKTIYWGSKGLLEISHKGQWSLLHYYVEKHGSIFPYFGYLTIFLLNVMRLDTDCIDHNTKDELLIKFSDLILRESHSEKARKNNRKLIEEAKERLNTFTMHTFNKNHLPLNCDGITNPDDFTVSVIEAVSKAVPDNTTDALIKAANGDPVIAYSVNRAAEKHSDTFRRWEAFNKQPVLSLNATLNEDSLSSHLEKLKDSTTPELDMLLRESREKERDLFNTIKQHINDPTYLTDRQRQVISMCYQQGKRISFAKIGKELGIGREAVRQHHDAAIIKLRKLHHPENI